MQPMSPHPIPLWPALGLVFNAMVWGLSWWPFRQLEAAGLHPLWATALIYAVATGAIGLARPSAWGHVLSTPQLWVLVAAAGTTNAAFNWGVTVGDVVRVVLLFYLMPLWSVLLARVLLGERPGRKALERVALALAGAMVVLWPADGGWPLPRTLADALGVLGGFTFALNNVMLRREAHRPESARALAMFLGGALVAGTLAVALTAAGRIGGLPPAAPGWLAGSAALTLLFIASNLTLQYGASRLPAHVTAVIMVTEVFFATASSVALGAAGWSSTVALGGAMILGAAVWAAREGRPG
jgi:drug/metabolite transporter (DMT)-like permease